VPVSKDLTKAIADYLRSQGITGHSELAQGDLSEILADAFVDNCLTVRPANEVDISQAKEISAIVGFAFGNQFEAHGNRNAGPVVNKLLAETVMSYFGKLEEQDQKPDVVVVQWEIGFHMQNMGFTDRKLVVLEPKPDIEKDAVGYVNTKDVVERLIGELGGKPVEGSTKAEAEALLAAAKNKRILVVAHPDHSRRCVKTLGSEGFTKVSAAQHALPSDAAEWYDPNSGQLWTRTRHLYLLHDAIGCLSLHRGAMNKKAKGVGIWGKR
jgi:hypothetical protein